MTTNPRSNIKIGFTGIFLALSFLLPARCESPTIEQTAKSPPLLWELDLSKYGYQGRPPIPLSRSELPKFSGQLGLGFALEQRYLIGQKDIDLAKPSGLWTYQQGVVFTQPNLVAVFFVVHDDSSNDTPTPANASPSDPFRLVAVFLTANRGELIKKMDWPLPSSNLNISPVFFFPATKGRFIVGIGSILSLYSSDFALLARFDAHKEFEAIASPAGDTILLHGTRQKDGRWISQYDLLDDDRLSVKWSWEEDSERLSFDGSRYSLSQTGQTLWGDEAAWTSPPSLAVTAPGKLAKPWLSPGSLNFTASGAPAKKLIEGRNGFCDYGGFVNKNTIVVTECGDQEKLLVVSTEGQIVKKFDLGSEQLDGPVVASRDGKRFAVPSFNWGSFSNRDPAMLMARVFNLDNNGPELCLDVLRQYGPTEGFNFHTQFGDTRFGWGGLGLSPDGDQLAIKAGALVRVYLLPEKGQSSLYNSKCTDEKDLATSQVPAIQAAPAPTMPSPATQAQLTQQALTWFPADTETVIAANGPFLMPDLKRDSDETKSGEDTNQEIEGELRSFPIELFGFQNGLLAKHFKGQQILLGMEGSRHFRPPSGLGGGLIDGCAVIVFADDVTDRANSFVKDSSTVALRTEQIEGQKVTVFQERMEEDIWTTFVAFPKPNMAVAASNEEYLREVLARLNGKNGERALPDNLPEWKHVNTQAAVWAVRHYDKSGAAIDQTSPFGGKKSANVPDDKAVGLTFSFDPSKSQTATIVYLSGDENILQNVQKNFFPIQSELGARELNIQYRQTSAGVVEGSFDLTHIESAEIFSFVLVAMLGHVVYI